jgi:hypothetical protein
MHMACGKLPIGSPVLNIFRWLAVLQPVAPSSGVSRKGGGEEGELSPSFRWLSAGGDNRKRARSTQRRVGPKARRLPAPLGRVAVRASFPYCVRYPPPPSPITTICIYVINVLKHNLKVTLNHHYSNSGRSLNEAGRKQLFRQELQQSWLELANQAGVTTNFVVTPLRQSS